MTSQLCSRWQEAHSVTPSPRIAFLDSRRAFHPSTDPLYLHPQFVNEGYHLEDVLAMMTREDLRRLNLR